MRQSLDQGSLFGDDRADIYGGMFDMFLGQHIAQGGGLGIARMVKHQLEIAKPHERSNRL
jgi:Rod binding domain-containing protein